MSEHAAVRPATLDDLKRLVAHLQSHQVDYLLIGGYALFMHGYQRYTEDIDLLLPVDAVNGQRVIDALAYLPDADAWTLDPAWFGEGENIRIADEILLDLLFVAGGGETYASLQPYIQDVDLGDCCIRTVDLEGLLKTKQGVRPQDQADRLVLEAALRAIREKPPRP